ncbi:hypothetical protein [Paracoccus sp. ME4]|uniref:hypothetical protein n=1 Tax=Paracoccus sp. ME4 TaxID=3138066 RepID=UPI00398B8920
MAVLIAVACISTTAASSVYLHDRYSIWAAQMDLARAEAEAAQREEDARQARIAAIQLEMAEAEREACRQDLAVLDGENRRMPFMTRVQDAGLPFNPETLQQAIQDCRDIVSAPPPHTESQ